MFRSRDQSSAPSRTERSPLSATFERSLHLSSQDIHDFIALIKDTALLITDPGVVSAQLRDPDDVAVLACALAGDAQYIATGDHDLSTCAPSKGCELCGLPCFFNSFIRRHKPSFLFSPISSPIPRVCEELSTATLKRDLSDPLSRYFTGVAKVALYCAHRTIYILPPRLLVSSSEVRAERCENAAGGPF